MFEVVYGGGERASRMDGGGCKADEGRERRRWPRGRGGTGLVGLGRRL